LGLAILALASAETLTAPEGPLGWRKTFLSTPVEMAALTWWVKAASSTRWYVLEMYFLIAWRDEPPFSLREMMASCKTNTAVRLAIAGKEVYLDHVLKLGVGRRGSSLGGHLCLFFAGCCFRIATVRNDR